MHYPTIDRYLSIYIYNQEEAHKLFIETCYNNACAHIYFAPCSNSDVK